MAEKDSVKTKKAESRKSPGKASEVQMHHRKQKLGSNQVGRELSGGHPGKTRSVPSHAADESLTILRGHGSSFKTECSFI